MKAVSKTLLSDFYDLETDSSPVTNLAYAVIEHEYDFTIMQRIALRALELEPLAKGEFLGLRHLRGAQTLIAEVATLMHDSARLKALSDLCGTELEPYPFTQAGAHINYYEPDRVPIDFHTDGPPYVELIPLLLEGKSRGGAT